MSSTFNADFLSGIVRLQDDFMLLFDVDKVFTKSELQSISLCTAGESGTEA
jgi:chemotaxis signal transduction protein